MVFHTFILRPFVFLCDCFSGASLAQILNSRSPAASYLHLHYAGLIRNDLNKLGAATAHTMSRMSSRSRSTEHVHRSGSRSQCGACVYVICFSRSAQEHQKPPLLVLGVQATEDTGNETRFSFSSLCTRHWSHAGKQCVLLCIYVFVCVCVCVTLYLVCVCVS